MYTPKIIAFSGKMGVGKSTAIAVLNQLVNIPTANVKFAQPLYDMQEFIYQRISSVVKRPENFTKDRKLLQWLGTDWGRDSISQSLWIDLWKAEVAGYIGGIITCDDVRFDNEGEVIKSLGGKLILIESSKNSDRIDTTAGLKNHASEAGVDRKYIDAVVHNDGTLEEFVETMRKTYASLGV